jgi:hypothetical protein
VTSGVWATRTFSVMKVHHPMVLCGEWDYLTRRITNSSPANGTTVRRLGCPLPTSVLLATSAISEGMARTKPGYSVIAERIRPDSGASQEAFSICDIGQVGGDRQSQRSREYFRDQFLRIPRLVALADDLPFQVAAFRKEGTCGSRFRKEGTCGSRLDARPVLRKGLCLRHVKS